MYSSGFHISSQTSIHILPDCCVASASRQPVVGCMLRRGLIRRAAPHGARETACNHGLVAIDFGLWLACDSSTRVHDD